MAADVAVDDPAGDVIKSNSAAMRLTSKVVLLLPPFTGELQFVNLASIYYLIY